MRALVFSLSLVFALACGAPTYEGEGEGDGEGEGGPAYDDIDGSFVIDGDRPVTFTVPDDYDPANEYPLVLLLHGYGIGGAQFASATGFGAFAADNGLVWAAPEGRVDASGSPFWNAGAECCDFEATGVDDGAFLTDAIVAARAAAHIGNTYVIGHSNGAFMAQRLVCDHADEVDAIVSVAGARPSDCHPSRPVGVLQSHGTADDTVFYNGGSVGLGEYPSAPDTADAWSVDNGCTASEDEAPIDLDATLAGAETQVRRYTGCDAPTELWTTEGGGHVPNGVPDYFGILLDFLRQS